MQCFKCENEEGTKEWREWFPAKLSAYHQPKTALGKQYNFDLKWLGMGGEYSASWLSADTFFQEGDQTPADKVPSGAWVLMEMQV